MSVEDRVYDDRTEGATAYVAADAGVLAVAVSGNRVGRFGIDHRCTARDVAADGDRIAVATDETVLVGRVTEDVEYESTGHGEAVAVGFDAGDVVAAGPQGAIARRVGDEWLELADLDAPVRAVDGGFVAAGDGLYRADPDGLDFVGLDDATDVAARGPYAATGDGLYELGNGWIRAVEGAFDAVAVTGERAHAAGDRLWARSETEWHTLAVDLPGAVAGIAHAGGTYAVTTDGTVLAHAGDGLADDPETGWNGRSLGVGSVGGIAIPRS